MLGVVRKSGGFNFSKSFERVHEVPPPPPLPLCASMVNAKFERNGISVFAVEINPILKINFQHIISIIMKCYKCTCYEVCILAGEVVLCLEVNFSESDEGKDGDVIADTDQTDEPKTGWKDQNVAKMNLKFY